MTIVPLENSDMLERVIEFPMQITRAYSMARDLTLPSNYSNISNVMVLGMGGSGIVGEFLRVLLRNSHIPVYVNKHLVPPHFVNENTLVLAVTYSGKTQETLIALDACISQGAKAICITSSHRLKTTFETIDIPNLHCVEIPQNGHSRLSMGYMLIPALCILQNADILRGIDNDILETVEVLQKVKETYSPNTPVGGNPAYSLVLETLHRFPIIYGEYNFTDAVALRWKQLLNENSKVHCYCDTFPELLHNEIEAWNSISSTDENYFTIFLRDSIYENKIGLKRKVDATKYMLQQKGVKVTEFYGQGRSELARLLSLSYLGDFVSLYLAEANQVDPSTVRNIEFMKSFEFVRRY